MGKYRVQDEGCGEDFDAADEEAAFAYAKEWLRGGSWDRSQTLWLGATVFSCDDEGETDERLGSVSVTLEPDVPNCVGDEHVWRSPLHILGGMKENPGVFGSGGGVRIKEVCSECGMYRVTDTWATSPVNGTQGHTSVAYIPAEETSLDWVQQLHHSEVNDDR